MIHLPDLRLAIELLTPHLPRLHSIQDAAAIFEMSLAAYRRATRQIWGRTPQQVLDGVRLSQAIQLLREPGRPCWSVGLAIGIEDENYLARWFKRQTGRTMGEYRDLLRRGVQNVQHINPTRSSTDTRWSDLHL